LNPLDNQAYNLRIQPAGRGDLDEGKGKDAGRSPGIKPVWDPSGRRLAMANPDWTVRLWDVVVDKVVLVGQARKAQEERESKVFTPTVVLAWSGDGKRLASADGWRNTIEVWDPATGARSESLPGHSNKIRTLAWSRDGKRLASAGDDRTVKVWDLASAKDPLLLTLSQNRSNASVIIKRFPLAWSPDGGRLAVADDNVVNIWDIPTAKVVAQIYKPAEAVAWSPDGRRLAVYGHGEGTSALESHPLGPGFGPEDIYFGVRRLLGFPDLNPQRDDAGLEC